MAGKGVQGELLANALQGSAPKTRAKIIDDDDDDACDCDDGDDGDDDENDEGNE